MKNEFKGKKKLQKKKLQSEKQRKLQNTKKILIQNYNF